MAHRSYTATAVSQYHQVLGVIETTAILAIFRCRQAVSRYLHQVQLFRGLRPKLKLLIGGCDRYTVCNCNIYRQPQIENFGFQFKF